MAAIDHYQQGAHPRRQPEGARRNFIPTLIGLIVCRHKKISSWQLFCVDLEYTTFKDLTSAEIWSLISVMTEKKEK
jgi:hypothetical protein